MTHVESNTVEVWFKTMPTPRHKSNVNLAGGCVAWVLKNVYLTVRGRCGGTLHMNGQLDIQLRQVLVTTREGKERLEEGLAG